MLENTGPDAAKPKNAKERKKEKFKAKREEAKAAKAEEKKKAQKACGIQNVKREGFASSGEGRRCQARGSREGRDSLLCGRERRRKRGRGIKNRTGEPVWYSTREGRAGTREVTKEPTFLDRQMGLMSERTCTAHEDSTSAAPDDAKRVLLLPPLRRRDR